MKPFKKGLLVGLLLAFSCVGFMASKSKSNLNLLSEKNQQQQVQINQQQQ